MSRKLLSVDECVGLVTKHVVNEVIRIIEDQKDLIGDTATHSVYLSVLSTFIGEMLTKTLKKKYVKEKMSREEISEDVLKNFGNLKISIQEAVASGFSGAMKVFTGKTCEYYCKISLIPEPINKKPC